MFNKLIYDLNINTIIKRIAARKLLFFILELYF